MKNKLLIILLFCSTLFSKDILLLHSYHKGYEWSDSISKAVETSFKNTNVTIFTEYMDTKHIYTYQYKQQLFKFYKQKYQNKKFDLIIASDNNALNFLERYHNKIFINTPIVFCGINNFNSELFERTNIRRRSTGVIESVDIAKNVDLILKLHPKIKKLLVLNDTTTTGREIKKEFLEIKENYTSKIDIEYVDTFKIDQLQAKVQALDKHTVILFMLLFKDKTGKFFTFKDGLQSIVQNTKAPIYGLWDFYMPYGLVGGYLTNAYAQGLSASELAKKILRGVSVSNIDIITKSPNRYMFDYNKLKKFKVKSSLLPKDAIILNEPEDFYETYKYELTLLFIVFIIALLAIVVLIFALIDKKKAKQQLQLQLKFIETLLNTLTTPIFYKNKEGRYVGGNEAFCEFIGKPKYEILGKDMYDFFDGQEEFLNAHKEIEDKLLAGENVGEYTMEYETPNGKKQIMLVNKNLYYDLSGNVNGILTILHDITALVQAENTKKHHESFMAQQTKLAEIGEMISAIAHQWNEPLVEMSAIVQDLELQYKTSELSPNDIKTFVDDSMVQIQYMSKTLKDFRDFLKPSVKKSYFDIESAFDEVMNIIERQIKYSYIDLNIHYLGQKHIAYGYKNEFMQVLITIINNAKDAILKQRQKDEDLQGKIDIIIDSTKDITTITIEDNGCGIEEINKEKVFDPYFSTKSKGNGIGLYMSKVLINDKMNGKIYFCEASECTKSTKLVIELPKKGDLNENTPS